MRVWPRRSTKRGCPEGRATLGHATSTLEQLDASETACGRSRRSENTYVDVVFPVVGELLDHELPVVRWGQMG